MGLVARTCRAVGAALPGAVTSKDSCAVAGSRFVYLSELMKGSAPSSKVMSAGPASRMVPPQRCVALRSSRWTVFKTGSDVELLISVMLRRPKCSQTRSGNHAGCARVSNEFCDICLHCFRVERRNRSAASKAKSASISSVLLYCIAAKFAAVKTVKYSLKTGCTPAPVSESFEKTEKLSTKRVNVARLKNEDFFSWSWASSAHPDLRKGAP